MPCQKDYHAKNILMRLKLLASTRYTRRISQLGLTTKKNEQLAQKPSTIPMRVYSPQDGPITLQGTTVTKFVVRIYTNIQTFLFPSNCLLPTSTLLILVHLTVVIYLRILKHLISLKEMQVCPSLKVTLLYPAELLLDLLLT